MLKYMLDTDICIYAIKNQPAEVKRAFENHYGQFCISAVTAMELVFGAEKSSNVERNLTVIEGFIARLDVLDYGKAAATQTAQIKAELAKKGSPIGAYDVMLAGHARCQGLIMVTNNLREFSKVSGLRSESWVSRP
ncbi:MAG: tRNA(fMet)-specific endonuclease VapC [Limnobacter sp.]|uniref:type II toxin-antitoxin system tRNA(fMet)-specific endonuclease VapC n=1 Tax=Limnobacter sp. TaxID=2003368 RepID=UPI0032EFFAC9